jgi:hypothetical protein
VAADGDGVLRVLRVLHGQQLLCAGAKLLV